MATLTKFYPFVEALAEKKHNLASDTLKIALSSVAPTASNATLSDITQIAYTNLSARTLTVSASAQADGVYSLILDDLTLSASGTVEAFRYIIIYNDTASNDELIGWYDYGSTVNLVSGHSLTINFDNVNGVIQIT